MPKEVIKEATYKNLKHLEQKGQWEITSKFNNNNNPNNKSHLETLDKTALMNNNQAPLLKKENVAETSNKKKKITSLLISEESSQLQNISKTAKVLKSLNANDHSACSFAPANLNSSNSNKTKEVNNPHANEINSRYSANNFHTNKGGNEANNYADKNFNINYKFSGINQNQNINFFSNNYNNFYANNSNITNINNFNYTQNLMYQQNLPNSKFATGPFTNTYVDYNLNSNNIKNNQNNKEMPSKNASSNQPNLNVKSNKLINKKKKVIKDLFPGEEKTNMIKSNNKTGKYEEIFEHTEEILINNLTDYSEEKQVNKEAFEDYSEEIDLQEFSEESEYEYKEELSSRNSIIKDSGEQQEDINKFNFNFCYNFNNMNKPFISKMTSFAEPPYKSLEFPDANSYSNYSDRISSNINNPRHLSKVPFGNNINNSFNNAYSNNNLFANPDAKQQPFRNFFTNNNFNSSYCNKNSYAIDLALDNSNNTANYPFSGYNENYNFGLFAVNSNNNSMKNTNSNFNSINPNSFPNGSANKNVYNFFSNNYNNENNNLMNYNIFDMINADSALIFSYFNKLNLKEDKINSTYQNDNKLANYYQYKLFDFNGENINFACLNYDQNKEKIQLFKEDELEKEKYNIAKTIDDESIDEKLENQNFFGPHKGIVFFLLLKKMFLFDYHVFISLLLLIIIS